jgi:hypothetical protein
MKIRDKLKLRDYLSRSDSVLHARFKAFELQATKFLEWAHAGAHSSFTAHGLSHINKLEEIYDWLLSDEDINNFSAAEAFCLLCATYCHDLFMIPKYAGDEARARRDHANKAASELRRLQDKLGLTTSEATYVGEIIRGHHVENISELGSDVVLGSDRVRLRMLGACLSMADILHADESRAPQIVFQYLTLEEESAWHWKRHMQISGVNRSGNKIALSAITFSDEGKGDVEKYASEIGMQLKRVSPYFGSELEPLIGIEVRIQELESEFDQDLSFKTDTTAILNMLVSGVYQDPNVFVRELIQNALDATYVEAARCKKNGIPYHPKIAVTELRDVGGKLLGIRIDDNGSGMDVAEVKDTLLWIGQSRNANESVKNLLKETGKNLIANFGVGLLSCFRVAWNVIVRTQKGEAGRPFEVAIGGFGERINLSAVQPDVGGTSAFVFLKEEFRNLRADEILGYYCRMVSLAEIYLFTTRDEDEFQSTRRDLLAAVETGGTRIDSADLGEGSVAVEGNGYYCRINVPWKKEAAELLATDGTLEILNDGIFVCEERTIDWLPESLGYCSGFINFAAKAIDLPVARDAIVNNQKLEDKRNELIAHSHILFEKVAVESQKKQFRDQVAIMFAYGYLKTPEKKRAQFLREVGRLHVQLFDGSSTTLEGIAKSGVERVYVCYKEGSWVNHLANMDGVALFYKKDEIAAMQAELAHKAGSTVIEAVRADKISGGISKVREFDVIAPYLKMHNIQVIDLLESCGGVCVFGI